MPIYEFQCSLCGEKFERKRSINDTSDEKCPRCDTIAQRVFTPASIIFKGSGFYVTDSKKPSEKRADGNRKDDAVAVKQ